MKFHNRPVSIAGTLTVLVTISTLLLRATMTKAWCHSRLEFPLMQKCLSFFNPHGEAHAVSWTVLSFTYQRKACTVIYSKVPPPLGRTEVISRPRQSQSFFLSSFTYHSTYMPLNSRQYISGIQKNMHSYRNCWTYWSKSDFYKDF